MSELSGIDKFGLFIAVVGIIIGFLRFREGRFYLPRFMGIPGLNLNITGLAGTMLALAQIIACSYIFYSIWTGGTVASWIRVLG